MKTLLLLRHAKSSWDNPGGRISAAEVAKARAEQAAPAKAPEH